MIIIMIIIQNLELTLTQLSSSFYKTKNLAFNLFKVLDIKAHINNLNYADTF
jgi:hypothetical protein